MCVLLDEICLKEALVFNVQKKTTVNVTHIQYLALIQLLDSGW